MAKHSTVRSATRVRMTVLSCMRRITCIVASLARIRHPESVTTRHRSLRHWTPATHDYTGQAVGLYDGAILLVEAQHIQVGDHVLLGSAQHPNRYRVRYVAHAPGYPEYWRVQLERLAPQPAMQPEERGIKVTGLPGGENQTDQHQYPAPDTQEVRSTGAFPVRP